MKCYDVFADTSFQMPEFKLSDSTFYRDIELFSDAVFHYVTTNAPQHSHKFICDMAEKFIGKYHLNVNDGYRRMLSLLNKPDSYILLYPYQPNIFPSVSVVAPFIYMNLTADIIKRKYGVSVIPVYLIVDYDCKTDRRFSSSYIPSVKNTAARFNIGYPTNKDKSDIMMSCEKPSRMLVESWMKNILNEFNGLRHKAADVGKEIEPNIVNVFRMIDEAYNVADSFASFNSAFLYNLINIKWNLSVIFIEGHNLYNGDVGVFKNYQTSIEEITGVITEVNTLLNNNYNCDEKFNFTLKDIFWKYSKNCRMRCKNDKTCELKCVPDYIFPTVLTDYLNDYLYLGKVAAIGYYKQAYLTVLSDSIVKKVFNIEPCPQLLTRAGIYCNKDSAVIKYLVQKAKNIDLYLTNIEDSHCSILFFLLTSGFDKTKEYIINSKII